MYYFFLDRMQLPVPPSKIETKIKGKNKTITLMNVGEVNLIKTSGLTDITFSFLLPNSDYPFAQTILGFRKSDYYTKKLEKLKVSDEPFRFICIRLKGNTILANTNMLVTLEDYTILESAEEGFDWIVTVQLKMYRHFGTKKIEITQNEDGTKTGKVSVSRPSDKLPNKIATIQENQTLQQIVKKEFGNTDNLFKIAAVNRVIPFALKVGEVLTLRE